MAQTNTVSSSGTTEISRGAWIDSFNRFTQENRGAHAALEVLGPDTGRYVELDNRPFDGISADLKDGEDVVWMFFGQEPENRLTHGIHNVTAVRVRSRSNDFGAAIEVDAADGTKTLLELSRPEDYELAPAE